MLIEISTVNTGLGRFVWNKNLIGSHVCPGLVENFVHVLSLYRSLRLSGRLIWQRKFQDSLMFRLWYGYCCELVASFTLRIKSKQHS